MIKAWLPSENISELFLNKKTVNIKELFDYAYQIFKNELKNENNPLIFQGKKVVINSPLFNCKEKFVKKGKNCNNTVFNCNNCPYLGREEMFFHVTSNKDDSLTKNLKSKYRKYKKNRVPGIFSYERLNHIKWIRAIIQEYEKNKNKDIKYFDEFICDKNTNVYREKIMYFLVEECQFIVIIGQNLWDKKQVDYYLKSAYIINTDDAEYKFSRLYKKYKKRQEINSGVS